MLTLNADAHPLMSRMHKPDPKLGADQQDKRSVVPIELADVDQWLLGGIADANLTYTGDPGPLLSIGPPGLDGAAESEDMRNARSTSAMRRPGINAQRRKACHSFRRRHGRQKSP